MQFLVRNVVDATPFAAPDFAQLAQPPARFLDFVEGEQASGQLTRAPAHAACLVVLLQGCSLCLTFFELYAQSCL